MSALYAEEIVLPGKRWNNEAIDENFMKLLFHVFI